jgi:hypothetical protein
MNIQELIETVKGLDDTALTEFLKGLGVYDEDGEKPEIEQVKDTGATDTATPVPKNEEEQTKTEEPTAEIKSETQQVESADGKVEEKTANPVTHTQPTEENKTEETKIADNETPAEEKPTVDPPLDTAGDIDGNEEEIPAMVRGVDAPAEDAQPEQIPQLIPEMPTPAPVQADNGQPIPTDFESIIDGLNAKVAALESEKAILQAKAEKVDAAFGYMARPPETVKMDNGLYDPTFNVKMHR